MTEYKKLSITPEAYKALAKYKVDRDLQTYSHAILDLIRRVELWETTKKRK